MPPKRRRSAKAKAKARAVSLATSNKKRTQRRLAVKVFNELADELSLGGERLDPKGGAAWEPWVKPGEASFISW